MLHRSAATPDAFTWTLRLAFLLVLVLGTGLWTAEDGRYTRPEEAPVFQELSFISRPPTRAYPGTEFNLRPAVVGGTWPYRFALRVAPAGMAIDERTGTLTWQAPEVAALTVEVAITVEDSAGRTAEQAFTVEVGTTGFFFVSPEGDDANPGTRDAPWKTVMRAAEPVANPEKSTLYLRGGTYRVLRPAAPGKKKADWLDITQKSPRRWIAWPGERPVIDLGWSQEQWQAALAAETAAGNTSPSTMSYGRRIQIVGRAEGLLFDGLEVKNAAYFMFVLWNGEGLGVTWRRCHFHHLYSDYMENSSFIFTYAAERKYAGPRKERDQPWGLRPEADCYRNLVVQDCLFEERWYDNPKPGSWHGGGVTWYTVRNSLIEDCRFQHIRRGMTILDKDNGWENTYRNNLLLGNVMLASQGCNDAIDLHHNYISGSLTVGSQPGWLRNIWIHHNAIGGGISLMGGGIRPEPLDIGDRTFSGPADPATQFVISDFPRDRRLVFVYANVIDARMPGEGGSAPHLFRLKEGADFAETHRFVEWNGNLVDEDVQVAIGWSKRYLPWEAFAACGFDRDGARGTVILDAEGRLPPDSPWRASFGREVGLVAPAP